MSLREAVLASGTPDARRLRLHIPAGTPPRDGWPLLVLLDGDWVWPLDPPPEGATACAVLIPSHGGLHGPVLPRWSRPGASAESRGLPQALAQRALDFTPPAPDGGRWPDPRRPEWQCGGADAFLDTLLGPMLAWAATQAPLDPARLSLYGHSYGGLCALYALVRHPGRFARLFCASPSLWWHEGRIEALLDELPRARPTGPIRLTLMAGTDERWHPLPPDPARPRRPADGVPTLPRLEALRERLADIPWLDCILEPLDGAGHGDALQASAQRALTLAAT
ncbi:MAG: alpha/beta fold hydrolase [Castellaniella sp.]|uniref:alpha/beta hydrolase n=1 Tax=Castellaniella sp. TaxID=1955812 RepID=UPI003C780DEF